jgi:energy-converting hydrogenase A subunit M
MKRIKFIRGVLYQKVAKAYEVDVLDVDFVIKDKLKFTSLKDLDSEGLDEVINYLDQMLLAKGIDINLDYCEAVKR